MEYYYFWFSRKQLDVCTNQHFNRERKYFNKYVQINNKPFVEYTECNKNIKETFGNWDDYEYIGRIEALEYWNRTKFKENKGETT